MAKSLLQYKNLSRLPIANHLRASFASTGRYSPLAMFEEKQTWAWVSSYLNRYLFRAAHEFPDASNAPNQSMYQVPNDLRVSIAGDWGTGTREAESVAEQMIKWENGAAPDLT